jgi:RNA polymerase sigma-70 factor (ECF subfamily)
VKQGIGRELVKTIAPSFFTLKRAAGHVQQFQSLILPHLDGAYNLARYLSRDAVLADDIVQDAMVRAFRAFPQFRGGSPRAWLFAIVRNCCRTAQSSAAGRVAVIVHESGLSEEAAGQLNQHADPRPNPEEEAMRQADVGLVRTAIEAIPEPFREVIVLRELEELSYAEIGEVTGVPIGTVMSRLARGRAMLAKELLPAGEPGDERSRSVKQ